MKPDFSIEESLQGIVCGIDEAGRGPLAGPVVAAAIILERKRLPASLTINDSKQMKAAEREAAYAYLTAHAICGIGQASVEEIDRLNIYQANFLAMQRAFAALGKTPRHALVDGNRAPHLACKTHPVVKGDTRSLSIAAASILAKVTRDRIMLALAEEYPQYGFERHAGYGTPQHLAALRNHGPCPHHRTSFAPVRACYEAASA